MNKGRRLLASRRSASLRLAGYDERAQGTGTPDCSHDMSCMKCTAPVRAAWTLWEQSQLWRLELACHQQPDLIGFTEHLLELRSDQPRSAER